MNRTPPLPFFLAVLASVMGNLMNPRNINHEIPILAALTFAVVVVIFVCQKRRRLEAWIDSLSRFFSPESKPDANVNWHLFWVSFAALYVEIMMIRWIGTEVRVFAFFQNLALIACFLGFGLGCYWSSRHKSLVFSLLAIVGLTILAEAPQRTWQVFLTVLSSRLSVSSDAAMWGSIDQAGGGSATWFLLFAASVVAVATFLLFLVVLMIPLGQWVGFYLDHATDPIQAYSANLLGSLAGIWVFAGVAFLRLPPSYWFAVAIGLLVLMAPVSRRLAIASLVAMAGVLLLFQYAHEPGARTYWSPYQKLEVQPLGDGQQTILVNNTGYMNIANMTPEFLARNPGIAEHYREESSYDAPFRFAQGLDRVLIVGAGAGNDAAAALRNGANEVDAVEIDPVILSLGEQLHPEHPYSSPRVHKILNDARAFLRQSREKYDVIMFGLLDSHTQFSDYSNMRIDNYVYTEEAFRQARSLLKLNGILVVKFEVRAPWTWMGQRFDAMLQHIFGRTPIVFYAHHLGGLPPATVFIESDDPNLWTRGTQPALQAIVAKNPPSFALDLENAPPPTTDDWPYIYHRSHSIPRTYFTVSLILLAMTVFLVRGALKPEQASTWHFFFLGAGFLLLETQLVSRLALYFGTTWLVNCVALTAILLVLVLANFYVSLRRSDRLLPYYVVLVLFLLGNYLFPWHRLPYTARTVGVLLSIAYAVPVFFAGIIFTESFSRHAEKSAAFGANIVGAVAGGLAQNLSFIFGMKVLLIFASVFYASALFFGLRDGGEQVLAANQGAPRAA
jgi:spermidine synthase